MFQLRELEQNLIKIRFLVRWKGLAKFEQFPNGAAKPCLGIEQRTHIGEKRAAHLAQNSHELLSLAACLQNRSERELTGFDHVSQLTYKVRQSIIAQL